MCAVHEPNTPLTSLLLRQGKAQVDLQDATGWTALHHAAKQGHNAQVALLLAHGASVRVRDHHGVTALALSAAEAQWECCKLMLGTVQTLARSTWTLDDDAVGGGGGGGGGENGEESLVALVQPVLLPAAQAAQWDVAQLALECGARPEAFMPNGGRVLDLLPSFVLAGLKGISAQRRADALIHCLYEHVTSSIMETILDYDDGVYPNGAASAAGGGSDGTGGSGGSVSLARILAHLRAVEAAQDRVAAEKRREQLAKALTSRSSSSGGSGGESSNNGLSPLSVVGGGANPSPSPSHSASGISVSGTDGHASTNAISSIAPPSQQSAAGAVSSGTRLPPYRISARHHSPMASNDSLSPFSSPQPQQQQQQPQQAAAAGLMNAVGADGTHFVFSPVPLGGGRNSGSGNGGFIPAVAAQSASSAAHHLSLPPSLRSAITQASIADNDGGNPFLDSAGSMGLSPRSGGEPRSGGSGNGNGSGGGAASSSSSEDDASASPLVGVELLPLPMVGDAASSKEHSRSFNASSAARSKQQQREHHSQQASQSSNSSKRRSRGSSREDYDKLGAQGPNATVAASALD
jgi:hypothetical protein